MRRFFSSSSKLQGRAVLLCRRAVLLCHRGRKMTRSVEGPQTGGSDTLAELHWCTRKRRNVILEVHLKPNKCFYFSLKTQLSNSINNPEKLFFYLAPCFQPFAKKKPNNFALSPWNHKGLVVITYLNKSPESNILSPLFTMCKKKKFSKCSLVSTAFYQKELQQHVARVLVTSLGMYQCPLWHQTGFIYGMCVLEQTFWKVG